MCNDCELDIIYPFLSFVFLPSGQHILKYLLKNTAVEMSEKKQSNLFYLKFSALDCFFLVTKNPFDILGFFFVEAKKYEFQALLFFELNCLFHRQMAVGSIAEAFITIEH